MFLSLSPSLLTLTSFVLSFRSIEELKAPDFKRTTSTDIICQRAAERERYREQSLDGTIKRMQFTFSIDQPPAPGANLPVKKPDLKPSPEFTKRTRATARAQTDGNSVYTSTTTGFARRNDDMVVDVDDANDVSQASSSSASQSQFASSSQAIKFDSIFDSGF